MSFKVVLGQFNAVMGDFGCNFDKICGIYGRARDADLLVLPELCICGYPPEDLLLKPHFLRENRVYVEKLAKACPDIAIIVGFAEQCDGNCYNSAALLRNGKVESVYRKCLLPNYGVFDEYRYFSAGSESLVADIGGNKVGITICEDIWDVNWLKVAVGSKLDLLVNISGSPFHIGKVEQRKEILGDAAKAIGCPVAYCNLVGGQDELVFDGQSMFVNADGSVAGVAKAFEECLLAGEIENHEIRDIDGGVEQVPELLDEIYQALVVGVRDYIGKNNFGKVVIGLSGGIDSSIVAAIAVDALGRENVVGVTMPSKFNSSETISDAAKLAENLGIEFETIPIEPMLKSFDEMLGNVDGWDKQGLAFENLQSRVRGNLLMALSNKKGYIVLTTGNKSETAVGYSTLYGDTAGGFAVIKDVPKTLVYKLCEYVNNVNGREVIPQSVIDRPPSAELREDQFDSDSLPDYDLLDAILKGYVEEDKSAKQLVEMGLDRETVNRVVMMVDRNEYKRRQSPPGVKITPKAFGRDRRVPITNRYRTQANL